MTPVSQLGRLLTVLIILTGIILIPWQVGVIKQLVKSSNQKHILCTKCGLNIHDRDANFCRNCGTQLISELPQNLSESAVISMQIKI